MAGGSSSSSSSSPSASIFDGAQLQDTKGNIVEDPAAALKGTSVGLLFAAKWCGSSLHYMPQIQKWLAADAERAEAISIGALMGWANGCAVCVGGKGDMWRVMMAEGCTYMRTTAYCCLNMLDTPTWER